MADRPDDSMYHISNEANLSHSMVQQEEATSSQKQPLRRFWRIIMLYPLPLGALTLLAVALAFWLMRYTDLARWTLCGIILLGGIPLLWETLQQFWHKQFSVDLIAILAIGGSLLLGEYLAGAFVVLMLSGGEALEAYALKRARSSLSALADRAPRIAHIREREQLVDIPAETVEVGMQIVVKPGELVPVDGVVIAGSSSISEADLTGEPVPVHKAVGMAVLSGSVNLDGVLEIRASKRSVESKYAQIVRLVEEAQEKKAPIHRLADRYSFGFTVVAVLLAVIAWALSGNSVYALAVLVVATPCPLILATPIAIVSGIDVAARHGIIVKSGAAIEQLGEVDVAVFDKTGTLTLGIPKVVAIILQKRLANEMQQHLTEEMLLRYAASIEQLSTHILAHAIVEAAQERQLSLSPVDDFEEVFGKGIQGRVPCVSDVESNASGTVAVAVGHRSFMEHMGILLSSSLLAERDRRAAAGQICSFVALKGEVVGLIVMEDIPRAEMAHLSPGLKKEKIGQVVLLTGDSDVVAQQVGAAAHVDRVVARCLPEEKVRIVQELQHEGHRVLMVGDGVNDAPALAAATVGMALGTQGLTAAASAADTVLLSTNILRVVTAVYLGRRVMRVALQGIWIGMGLSALAMLIAAYGWIAPATGAILQEGIDVLVILNALRVSRIKMESPLSK